MNSLEYLRKLKAVSVILTVVFVLICRGIRLDLSIFHPWFNSFLFYILFIVTAVGGIFIIFRLAESRIAILERRVSEASGERGMLIKLKTDLDLKVEILSRKIEELSTLHRIIRAMNQTIELDKILNIILESICKYLSYDRAVLCLVDDTKNSIEAKHAIGSGLERLSRIKLSMEDRENFIVNTVLSRIPAIIDEIPDSVKVFGEDLSGGNVVAVVPLESKDRIIGALIVDNARNRRRIEERDLRALQTFTGQAAAAIENARLYQTEKNFKEELQKQVDIAIERLKQTQDQLIQSEKLAALGQMAAVVTHEVRNPLSTIRGSAEIISRKAGPDSPLKKFTEYIIQEVERLDLVVTEILTFSRKPQLALSKENVNKLIEQTLDFLEASDFAKYRINCIKDLSKDLPDTLLDRDQIKQVLLNIIQNACHFMEKSKLRTLTVRTSTSDAQIKIEVADTGPGIPQENLEKIFEPFFTTKVRGTGLGLSICKNIVESHMGNIGVISKQDMGTTFIVNLPVLKKEGSARR